MDEEAFGALSVTVRRSGGFAGVTRAWALSLADADDEVAGRLRSLASSAAGAPAAAPAPGPADGFSYEVLLESEGGSSALRGSERTLPPPLAELVELVRAHGSPVQP
ncbi:hypothetical protein CLV35_2361 [Motilibacter peucedani]|uniref:Uncharacterized protein n=1 Tax=Motilibacter peucedani TaxID=598650 RepID=A0A420XNV2_9ACTN|nr:protealysin inhibitor emfourin [Motilibacter peucedani]RKS73867.1 hypothetical protein CLV35_2361 [Motilibacter peucedani]